MIHLDPELQHFLPRISAEDFAGLEAKLLAEGCVEPLVLWDEKNVLVDGHHRYEICQKHGLHFPTRTMAFADTDAAKLWMLEHQQSRRNYTKEERDYYLGKTYELRKNVSRGGGDRKSDGTKNQKDHNDPFDTAKELATVHKVSAPTVKRAAAFTRSVDTVAKAVGDDARQDILSGATQLDRQDVNTLAAIATSSPQTARHVVEAVQKAPTAKAKKKVIRDAAKDVPKAPPRRKKPAVKQRATPALTLEVQDAEPYKGIEELPTADGKTLFVLHNPDSEPVFNRTNEMVDWASWTWNPVTGCWHGCDYCYAREIANNTRMAEAYPKQFEPTFHPARLSAPANTPFPKTLTRPADRNVFVCSMADLFGKWVPDDWIMAVFAQVIRHQQWNFLFLTKFPQRLQEVCDTLGGFPDNAWVGCTVDRQARVATAEKAFRHIKAPVRWLSVEPMLERITFPTLQMFDWVVMGDQTASYYNKTPASQPQLEWVKHLWDQAQAAGLPVYWKENLTVRPKELPGAASRRSEVAP